MFSDFAKSAAAFAAKFPFDNVVWLTWGSFAAIFVLAVTLCLALPNVRSASKRPFLCLVYCYTAVTFAVFLTANPLEQSAFVASIFWVVGYLCYGLLCVLSCEKTVKQAVPAQVAVAAAPVIAPPAQHKPLQPAPQPLKSAAKQQPSSVNAVARNNVRLDHAIAVTARLLEKNLGKTDRQELEKLKNTLEVLKVKGTLTPAEGEILNENFNTLLKLMAKYNV